MIKRPILSKKRYSEPTQWLLNSRNHLLEVWPDYLIILGSGGLWVAFWIQDREGLSIDSSRSWLKKVDIDEGIVEFKNYDRYEVEGYCGELKSWRALKDRRLKYLRRHHPELVRPNQLYVNGGQQNYAYLAREMAVKVNITKNVARIKFDAAKVKPQSVWHSGSARGDYVQSLGQYLFNEVFLTDPNWQDPSPWLDFVEQYQTTLTPSLKRRIYTKLLNQFGSDFTENLIDDLPDQLLKRARQGWWSVNPTILNRLALGTKYLKGSARLVNELNNYIKKQDANLQPDLKLAWFDNFLPLATKKTFSGLPLNVAEYVIFLHNNVNDEVTYDHRSTT